MTVDLDDSALRAAQDAAGAGVAAWLEAQPLPGQLPAAAVRYAEAFARARIWHDALREQLLIDLIRDELADDVTVLDEISVEHQAQMRAILDARWGEIVAPPATEPSTETIAACYARAAAELVREAYPAAVAETAYAVVYARACVQHWARPGGWSSWAECLADCIFGEPVVLAAVEVLGDAGTARVTNWLVDRWDQVQARGKRLMRVEAMWARPVSAAPAIVVRQQQQGIGAGS
jgi:hypothetical protein